jgi:glycosyltransferase
MEPSISVITVVYNGAQTIADCLESVSYQTYQCEHIIIDGGSTDGTQEIVRKYPHVAKILSEQDNGIYDAMNKGIAMANGDIIGILNADDVYANNGVLKKVCNVIRNEKSDCCYADLDYVDKNNTNQVRRHWVSGKYQREKFKRGWMPPHPTFFVKREYYKKYGLYNTDFPIAADYELMLRFLYKHKLPVSYIPDVLVKMRTGGASNPGLINTAKAMRENYQAWKVNDLDTNMLTFIMKPASKILQYY